MADLAVDIGSSFELLSSDEWQKYLDTEIFDSMIIDIACFNQYRERITLYPRLEESIKGHFNKVGSLITTYALCRHYYDKGIPDDPWFISPGKEGQSVQYVPNFEKEHWMRRFWFNHFAENIYLKYFSLWDNVIILINIFYGLNYPSDQRQKANVMSWLKSEKREMFDYLNNILTEPVYVEANKYRTSFVHGIAPSEVSNEYTIETDKMTDIHKIDASGKVVTTQVKATVFSCGVGEYTLVSDVMKNIDEFAVFCGGKIQGIVNLMLT